MGKSLNETYQISDWMNRPLNEHQIVYAATDAYCLLQIYNKIKQNFETSSFCRNGQSSIVEFYKNRVDSSDGKKRKKKKTNKNNIL